MIFMNRERTDARQLFPSPSPNEEIWETPPTLSWLGQAHIPEYRVTLRNAQGKLLWEGKTDKSYITPNIMPEPGKYFWNAYGVSPEKGEMEWGETPFSIAEGAVHFPRPTLEQIWNSTPDGHPRHLFFPSDIEGLKRDKSRELGTLRRNIKAALSDGLPELPNFHRDPEALPYREYLNYVRVYIDRDLVACSLGWAVLGDREAGEHARKLLLAVCNNTPNGPCSLLGPWGDEIGLSLARCLPAVYDLIYDLLSREERIFAEQTVASFAQQCEDRLSTLDYCQNPGESHAGRIPAYMGEAAMVLKGSSIPEYRLKRWLSYALEIYGGIFPHFGGPDGSWAEGIFYASSYTRWYLPFFCAVERYSGVSFLSRPFYQRFTQYLLHFASPKQEIHPFADGYWCNPEDPEWPGFFAQNPCRLYAQRFGPQAALDRAKEAAAPDIFWLHLLDAFIPDGKAPKEHITGEAEDTAVFPYAGLLSSHSDLLHPEKDIALLARASRFGSASHQHSDNGSFALFNHGIALISPSGYFGRQYGTRHHREWTNTSRAHNMILVNGEGQETWSHRPVGKIVFCEDDGSVCRALLDLSESYPALNVWRRSFLFEKSGKLTVLDHIEAPEEVTIDYMLHALSRPSAEGNHVIIRRRDTGVDIFPAEGLKEGCTITDHFPFDINDGEPEKYHVTMPQQFHMQWTTEKKNTHDILVVFKVL